jgi:hypothetical protein
MQRRDLSGQRCSAARRETAHFLQLLSLFHHGVEVGCGKPLAQSKPRQRGSHAAGDFRRSRTPDFRA